MNILDSVCKNLKSEVLGFERRPGYLETEEQSAVKLSLKVG